MLTDLPTVEEIDSLTPEELLRIKLSFDLLELHNTAWRTGVQALSDAYGLHMDDDDLLELEDAARERTRDKSLVSSVRWYYLASKSNDLASIQIEAITSPWHARKES